MPNYCGLPNHPLFNTGSSDALRRAISGYRPPQSILELKSKDESLGAAAKDFRAKIDRKKALEERCLPVWKSTSASGAQFSTKSFLGDYVAALAPSSGEEPTSPRHRAGLASMAWRSTRRFRTNAS